MDMVFNLSSNEPKDWRIDCHEKCGNAEGYDNADDGITELQEKDKPKEQENSCVHAIIVNALGFFGIV